MDGLEKNGRIVNIHLNVLTDGQGIIQIVNLPKNARKAQQENTQIVK
jgi:hypothetical protein